MEPYSVVITSKVGDRDKMVRVGQYDFQKSSTALPTSFGTGIGLLGDGISYYKDGRYRGYHSLSKDVFELPLENIVETAEFKQFLEELCKRS